MEQKVKQAEPLKEQLVKIFPGRLRQAVSGLALDFTKLQEIRLRVQRPVLIRYENREYGISEAGGLEPAGAGRLCVTRQEIGEALELIGNHSLYAYEEEIRQGFLTIEGGHRVGIAGKTVLDGRLEVKSMQYIHSLNVRIAHERKGCADALMPYLWEEGQVQQTLLIAPPCCGKTTLLRDVIRQLSDGTDAAEGGRAGMTVGVVDERSEIGACYMGQPQNDLGMRTDVLDCCPKAQGMRMLIRTMSPQVVAVDEIGSEEEMKAIRYVTNCGVKLIATVHGTSWADICAKPVLEQMIQQKLFDRYVVLGQTPSIGSIVQILDRDGIKMYEQIR